MAASDGDVVSMLDVLQEDESLEDEANAVLGASDDKQCTYDQVGLTVATRKLACLHFPRTVLSWCSTATLCMNFILLLVSSGCLFLVSLVRA
jgi:hypothetical protein